MRHFLKLIETARDHGVYDYAEQRDRDLTDAEWSALERCEPFVFTSTQGDETVDHLVGAPIEDAPFAVFSIEGISEAIGQYFAKVSGENTDRKFMEHLCVVVIENGPKSYEYLALAKFLDDPLRNIEVVKPTGAHGLEAVVISCLQRLQREKLGNEVTRATVKIGKGKAKRTHRIRRVIHVAPKSQIAKNLEAHRKVDWSHRFTVRGHWRVHAGLGKDRDGVYCVNGFTWVSNHTRGPEHLPLVTKVRLVSDTIDNQPRKAT